MSDPYLVLHKVRGQPAFDIAEKMTCAICQGSSSLGNGPYCDECNQEGHWWIIPTSGHRAYPLHQWNLGDLVEDTDNYGCNPRPAGLIGTMPSDWPDHYAANDRPNPLREAARQGAFRVNTLLEKLGLVKPTKVERRF